MFAPLKFRKLLNLLLTLTLTLSPLLSQSAQAFSTPKANSPIKAANDTCIAKSVRPTFVSEETTAKYRTLFLTSKEFASFSRTLQANYVGKFKVQLPALNVIKLNAPQASTIGVVVDVDGGAGSSSFSEWFDASGNLTTTIASIFELLPDGKTIEASIALNGKPHVHAFVTVKGEILSGTVWNEGKTILLNKESVNTPANLVGVLQCLWECLTSHVEPWYLSIVFAACAAVCVFYSPTCYWCFWAKLGSYLPALIECAAICEPHTVYLPLIANGKK